MIDAPSPKVEPDAGRAGSSRPARTLLSEALADAIEVAPGSIRVGDILVDHDFGRVTRVSGPRHDHDAWSVQTSTGRPRAWSTDFKGTVRVLRCDADVTPWLTPDEATALRSMADWWDAHATVVERHPSQFIAANAVLHRADARLLRDLVGRLTDG